MSKTASVRNMRQWKINLMYNEAHLFFWALGGLCLRALST